MNNRSKITLSHSLFVLQPPGRCMKMLHLDTLSSKRSYLTTTPMFSESPGPLERNQLSSDPHPSWFVLSGYYLSVSLPLPRRYREQGGDLDMEAEAQTPQSYPRRPDAEPSYEHFSSHLAMMNLSLRLLHCIHFERRRYLRLALSWKFELCFRSFFDRLRNDLH